MPEILSSNDFAAHLHSAFSVERPLALELELAEVDDRSNDAVEQFSLIFKGPESPWLRQGICTLQHPAMGQVDLFLVPLGPRDGRMVYQAVFSRLISAKQQGGAAPKTMLPDPRS